MAQQIELQRSQSGYDNETVEQLHRDLRRMTSEEGAQQLQREINEENLNLQRMTSEEERADRHKMRQIFNSVRIFFAIFFFKCLETQNRK